VAPTVVAPATDGATRTKLDHREIFVSRQASKEVIFEPRRDPSLATHSRRLSIKRKGI
jgi:hypothetical protein